MPIIKNSAYEVPWLIYKNPHISTIHIGRFKKTYPPEYERERLELCDGDFLDIDFFLQNKDRAVVLCHGLEGGSTRTYNNTSAKYFIENDFSVFAWNNRSCSGEMNRLPKLYHHGVIDDFEEMINFVLGKGLKEIYLLGFSMGGAQIMNYLGSKKRDDRIKAAVVVSTPIQLKSSAETLKNGFNRVYLKNFTYKIAKKLRAKSVQFPEALDWSRLNSIKTFDEIDEYFTAPLHGFKDKEDYYTKASPGYVMENIKVPTLILNSLDDPFLGKECYPISFAENHEFVYLEIPKHGGHCAFPMKNSNYSFSEIRALEFYLEQKSHR